MLIYENGTRIWSRNEFPISVLYIQKVNPIAKSKGTTNSMKKEIYPFIAALVFFEHGDLHETLYVTIRKLLFVVFAFSGFS